MDIEMHIVPKITEDVKMSYSQEIDSFLRLGKEIRISPKANCTLNKKGFRTQYEVESVSVTIGIGNDNIATLIMTKEAWEALQKGEEINITTTEKFKKQLYNH